ncbi:hypothetical protein [Chitinolyticbacter meiyuanensis]|uniref:hypothetical protein n=1 Tax=Chitinolyticbacter meiyuanensis TaxID=682798 RepID=UPI0016525B02|nr:hypothetical protein [Chitinolyticbacter meiyuanensis]
MRHLFAIVCLASATAYAHGPDPSGHGSPSDKLSVGTMSIVLAPSLASEAGDPVSGTVSFAAMGSAFVVTGIVDAGVDTVTLLLQPVKASGKASVTVARSVFEQSGIVIGKTVQAVSETSGTLLVASGKVLAFIPNALGEALLYEARIAGAAQ